MERTLLARLQWDLLLPSKNNFLKPIHTFTHTGFDRFLQAMLAVIGAPHLAASRLLLRNYEVFSFRERKYFYVSSFCPVDHLIGRTRLDLYSINSGALIAFRHA